MTNSEILKELRRRYRASVKQKHGSYWALDKGEMDSVIADLRLELGLQVESGNFY